MYVHLLISGIPNIVIAAVLFIITGFVLYATWYIIRGRYRKASSGNESNGGKNSGSKSEKDRNTRWGVKKDAYCYPKINDEMEYEFVTVIKVEQALLGDVNAAPVQDDNVHNDTEEKEEESKVFIKSSDTEEPEQEYGEEHRGNPIRPSDEDDDEPKRDEEDEVGEDEEEQPDYYANESYFSEPWQSSEMDAFYPMSDEEMDKLNAESPEEILDSEDPDNESAGAAEDASEDNMSEYRKMKERLENLSSKEISQQASNILNELEEE